MTLNHAQRQAITALVGATLTASLVLSGCGDSTTNSSSNPSSTSPVDYPKLFMNPADIVLPGQTFTDAKPPTVLPTGGAVVGFVNGDKSLDIVDVVVVMEDSATAKDAYEVGKVKLAAKLPGTALSDVSVGEEAVSGDGTINNGGTLVKAISFHEGSAFATIEFDSPANDPFPQEFAVAVAKQQDAAIKSGLAK